MTTLEVHPRFTLFDRAVFTIIFSLLLLTAVLIWRGDRVGVQVTQISPQNGSHHVSTQAILRITFSQNMLTTDLPDLVIEPPVVGSLAWEGRSLTFTPEDSLATNTDYTVTIPVGLKSQQGRELLEPIELQFQTGEPRLIFIAWNEAREGNQLYTIRPTGGEPTLLTNEATNVLDYAIAPDGQAIAYTVSRPNGGSDLWLIEPDGNGRRQLFACEQAACNGPTWSPDGQRIIYERRTFLAPGSPPGPPRLWWLNVATGETTAVFQDSQWLGSGPRFSADGQWISYASPQTQEIQAYNLTTGQSTVIVSRTGEPASWSPQGSYLLVTQLEFEGDSFAVNIVNTDVVNQTIVNISGDDEVNDGWPIWSPDGQWIAFTRKVPRTPEGKQVWIVRPDGREATNLTQNPDIHFGPPTWSPDGRYLTFQGYSLRRPDQPIVWLLDVETQEKTQLTTPGIKPSWLP